MPPQSFAFPALLSAAAAFFFALLPLRCSRLFRPRRRLLCRRLLCRRRRLWMPPPLPSLALLTLPSPPYLSPPPFPSPPHLSPPPSCHASDTSPPPTGDAPPRPPATPPGGASWPVGRLRLNHACVLASCSASRSREPGRRLTAPRRVGHRAPRGPPGSKFSSSSTIRYRLHESFKRPANRILPKAAAELASKRFIVFWSFP
jgi:hypothetical protein